MENVFDQLVFQSAEPYPETLVSEKNYHYASMIAEAYAGRESELTAILQYSFQHFVKSETEQRVANALARIAVVEMHHLEILGEMLVKLGSTPVFAGRRRQMYTASAVNYETDLVKLLNVDIENEYAAIDYYRYINARIDDEGINRVIDRIVEDEKQHIKVLKILLEYASAK